MRGILEVSLTSKANLGYRLVLGTEGKNRKKRKVGTEADISDSGRRILGSFTEIGNAARGSGGDHAKILQA